VRPRSQHLRDPGASPQVGSSRISSLRARRRGAAKHGPRHRIQVRDFIGGVFALDASPSRVDHSHRKNPRGRERTGTSADETGGSGELTNVSSHGQSNWIQLQLPGDTTPPPRCDDRSASQAAPDEYQSLRRIGSMSWILAGSEKYRYVKCPRCGRPGRSAPRPFYFLGERRQRRESASVSCRGDAHVHPEAALRRVPAHGVRGQEPSGPSCTTS
jgi:hypothetical protein